MNRRISFIAHDTSMFDALSGRTSEQKDALMTALGTRIAELCMTGPSTRNKLGLMAAYGIIDVAAVDITADVDRLALTMTIRLLRQHADAGKQLSVEEMRSVARTLDDALTNMYGGPLDAP